MSEIVLKSCPFCDGEAVLDEIKAVVWSRGHRGMSMRYITHCIDPHCVGHHGKRFADKITSIEKWNRRPGSISQQEQTVRLDDLREMIVSAIEASRK